MIKPVVKKLETLRIKEPIVDEAEVENLAKTTQELAAKQKGPRLDVDDMLLLVRDD